MWDTFCKSNFFSDPASQERFLVLDPIFIFPYEDNDATGCLVDNATNAFGRSLAGAEAERLAKEDTIVFKGRVSQRCPGRTSDSTYSCKHVPGRNSFS